jgi:hypothetical protein
MQRGGGFARAGGSQRLGRAYTPALAKPLVVGSAFLRFYGFFIKVKLDIFELQ